MEGQNTDEEQSITFEYSSGTLSHSHNRSKYWMISSAFLILIVTAIMIARSSTITFFSCMRFIQKIFFNSQKKLFLISFRRSNQSRGAYNRISEKNQETYSTPYCDAYSTPYCKAYCKSYSNSILRANH